MSAAEGDLTIQVQMNAALPPSINAEVAVIKTISHDIRTIMTNDKIDHDPNMRFFAVIQKYISFMLMIVKPLILASFPIVPCLCGLARYTTVRPPLLDRDLHHVKSHQLYYLMLRHIPFQ